MTYPIYRVADFEIVGPYTLRVVFDDGTEQVIDFRPVLESALYAPLQDESMFNQVEIDPEVHTSRPTRGRLERLEWLDAKVSRGVLTKPCASK